MTDDPVPDLTPEQYADLLKVAHGMRNGFTYHPELWQTPLHRMWHYPLLTNQMLYGDAELANPLARELTSYGKAAMRRYEAKHGRASDT